MFPTIPDKNKMTQVKFEQTPTLQALSRRPISQLVNKKQTHTVLNLSNVLTGCSVMLTSPVRRKLSTFLSVSVWFMFVRLWTAISLPRQPDKTKYCLIKISTIKCQNYQRCDKGLSSWIDSMKKKWKFETAPLRHSFRSLWWVFLFPTSFYFS